MKTRNLFALAVSASFAFAPGHLPGQTQPTPVIKSVSRLVLEDLIATDRSGKPITDLQANEITVFENGKPQRLSAFSLEQPPAASATHPPLPANVYTNRPEYTAPPGPLTVLLLDGLNTPFQDQAYARQQLIKYLSTQHDPNRRIAVIALGNSLKVLQDFTTDPRVVSAAIRKTGVNLAVTAPNDEYVNAAMRDGSLAPSVELRQQMIQDFLANVAGGGLDYRIELTLSALQAIALGLEGYPGRKKLVWISAAFPSVFSPDLQNRYNLRGSYMEEVRRTIDLLADAQVSVYAVDARGLVGADPTRVRQPGFGLMGSWFYGSQMTMEEVSEQTGGRAYVNQNEIDHGIAIAVDDGNSYYSLAYVPSDRKWDGSFRKIKIQVDRKDVELRYRRGYYARDPGARPDHKLEDAEMMALLAPGGFGSNMVVFDARMVPAASSVPIDVLIDPRTIRCDEESGYHCDIDLHVAAFSMDGKEAAHNDQRFNSTLKPEMYQALLGHGFPFHADLDLKPGAYDVRLVVRDNLTGRLGSLNAQLSRSATKPNP